MLKIMLPLVLVVSMLSSFFEFALAHPERADHAHSQGLSISEHYSEFSSAATPLSEERHCSPETLRCCHLSFILKSTHYAFVDKIVVPTYQEFFQKVKPSPFLEGPFQPPRV